MQDGNTNNPYIPRSNGQNVDLFELAVDRPGEFVNDIQTLTKNSVMPLAGKEYYRPLYNKLNGSDKGFDEMYKAAQDSYNSIDRTTVPTIHPFGLQTIGKQIDHISDLYNNLELSNPITWQDQYNPQRTATAKKSYKEYYDALVQMPDGTSKTMRKLREIPTESFNLGRNFLSWLEGSRGSRYGDPEGDQRHKMILETEKDAQGNPIPGSEFWLRVPATTNTGNAISKKLVDQDLHPTALQDLVNIALDYGNAAWVSVPNTLAALPQYINDVWEPGNIWLTDKLYKKKSGKSWSDNYWKSYAEKTTELKKLAENDYAGRQELEEALKGDVHVAIDHAYNYTKSLYETLKVKDLSTVSQQGGMFGDAYAFLDAFATGMASIKQMRNFGGVVGNLGGTSKQIERYGYLYGALQATAPVFDQARITLKDDTKAAAIALVSLPGVYLTEHMTGTKWVFRGLDEYEQAVKKEVLASLNTVEKAGLDVGTVEGQHFFGKLMGKKAFEFAKTKMFDPGASVLGNMKFVRGMVREGSQETLEQIYYSSVEKLYDKLADQYGWNKYNKSLRQMSREWLENGVMGAIVGGFSDVMIRNKQNDNSWAHRAVAEDKVGETGSMLFNMHKEGMSATNLDPDGQTLNENSRTIDVTPIPGLEDGKLKTMNDVVYYQAYQTLQEANAIADKNGLNSPEMLKTFKGNEYLISASLGIMTNISKLKEENEQLSQNPTEESKAKISENEGAITELQQELDDYVKPEQIEKDGQTYQSAFSPKLKERLLNTYIAIINNRIGDPNYHISNEDIIKTKDQLRDLATQKISNIKSYDEENKLQEGIVKSVEDVWKGFENITLTKKNVDTHLKRINDYLSSIVNPLAMKGGRSGLILNNTSLSKIKSYFNNINDILSSTLNDIAIKKGTTVGLAALEEESLLGDTINKFEFLKNPEGAQTYDTERYTEDNDINETRNTLLSGLMQNTLDIQRIEQKEFVGDKLDAAEEELRRLVKFNNIARALNYLDQKPVTRDLVLDLDKNAYDAEGNIIRTGDGTPSVGMLYSPAVANAISKDLAEIGLIISSNREQYKQSVEGVKSYEGKTLRRSLLDKVKALSLVNIVCQDNGYPTTLMATINSLLVGKKDLLDRVQKAKTPMYDNEDLSTLRQEIAKVENAIYDFAGKDEDIKLKIISSAIGLYEVGLDYNSPNDIFADRIKIGETTITVNHLSNEENNDTRKDRLAKRRLATVTNYLNTILNIRTSDASSYLAPENALTPASEQSDVLHQVFGYLSSKSIISSLHEKTAQNIKVQYKDIFNGIPVMSINGEGGAGKTEVIIPISVNFAINNGYNVAVILPSEKHIGIKDKVNKITKNSDKVVFFNSIDEFNYDKIKGSNWVIISDESQKLTNEQIDLLKGVKDYKARNIKLLVLGDFKQVGPYTKWSKTGKNLPDQNIVPQIVLGSYRGSILSRKYRSGYIPNTVDGEQVRNATGGQESNMILGYAPDAVYTKDKNAGVQYVRSAKEVVDEFLKDQSTKNKNNRYIIFHEKKEGEDFLAKNKSVDRENVYWLTEKLANGKFIVAKRNPGGLELPYVYVAMEDVPPEEEWSRELTDYASVNRDDQGGPLDKSDAMSHYISAVYTAITRNKNFLCRASRGTSKVADNVPMFDENKDILRVESDYNKDMYSKIASKNPKIETPKGTQQSTAKQPAKPKEKKPTVVPDASESNLTWMTKTYIGKKDFVPFRSAQIFNDPDTVGLVPVMLGAKTTDSGLTGRLSADYFKLGNHDKFLGSNSFSLKYHKELKLHSTNEKGIMVETPFYDVLAIHDDNDNVIGVLPQPAMSIQEATEKDINTSAMATKYKESFWRQTTNWAEATLNINKAWKNYPEQIEYNKYLLNLIYQGINTNEDVYTFPGHVRMNIRSELTKPVNIKYSNKSQSLRKFRDNELMPKGYELGDKIKQYIYKDDKGVKHVDWVVEVVGLNGQVMPFKVYNQKILHSSMTDALNDFLKTKEKDNSKFVSAFNQSAYWDAIMQNQRVLFEDGELIPEFEDYITESKSGYMQFNFSGKNVSEYADELRDFNQRYLDSIKKKILYQPFKLDLNKSDDGMNMNIEDSELDDLITFASEAHLPLIYGQYVEEPIARTKKPRVNPFLDDTDNIPFAETLKGSPLASETPFSSIQDVHDIVVKILGEKFVQGREEFQSNWKTNKNILAYTEHLRAVYQVVNGGVATEAGYHEPIHLILAGILNEESYNKLLTFVKPLFKKDNPGQPTTDYNLREFIATAYSQNKMKKLKNPPTLLGKFFDWVSGLFYRTKINSDELKRFFAQVDSGMFVNKEFMYNRSNMREAMAVDRSTIKLLELIDIFGTTDSLMNIRKIIVSYLKDNSKFSRYFDDNFSNIYDSFDNYQNAIKSYVEEHKIEFSEDDKLTTVVPEKQKDFIRFQLAKDSVFNKFKSDILKNAVTQEEVGNQNVRGYNDQSTYDYRRSKSSLLSIFVDTIPHNEYSYNKKKSEFTKINSTNEFVDSGLLQDILMTIAKRTRLQTGLMPFYNEAVKYIKETTSDGKSSASTNTLVSFLEEFMALPGLFDKNTELNSHYYIYKNRKSLYTENDPISVDIKSKASKNILNAAFTYFNSLHRVSPERAVFGDTNDFIKVYKENSPERMLHTIKENMYAKFFTGNTILPWVADSLNGKTPKGIIFNVDPTNISFKYFNTEERRILSYADGNFKWTTEDKDEIVDLIQKINKYFKLGLSSSDIKFMMGAASDSPYKITKEDAANYFGVLFHILKSKATEDTESKYYSGIVKRFFEKNRLPKDLDERFLEASVESELEARKDENDIEYTLTDFNPIIKRFAAYKTLVDGFYNNDFTTTVDGNKMYNIQPINTVRLAMPDGTNNQIRTRFNSIELTDEEKNAHPWIVGGKVLEPIVATGGDMVNIESAEPFIGIENFMDSRRNTRMTEHDLIKTMFTYLRDDATKETKTQSLHFFINNPADSSTFYVFKSNFGEKVSILKLIEEFEKDKEGKDKEGTGKKRWIVDDDKLNGYIGNNFKMYAKRQTASFERWSKIFTKLNLQSVAKTTQDLMFDLQKALDNFTNNNDLDTVIKIFQDGGLHENADYIIDKKKRRMLLGHDAAFDNAIYNIDNYIGWMNASDKTTARKNILSPLYHNFVRKIKETGYRNRVPGFAFYGIDYRFYGKKYAFNPFIEAYVTANHIVSHTVNNVLIANPNQFKSIAAKGKYNKSMYASGIIPLLGESDTLPVVSEVAYVSDIKMMMDLLGKQVDVTTTDGVSWFNPIASILLRNGAGGDESLFRGATNVWKTLYKNVDLRTGFGSENKFAEYVLNRDYIDNSKIITTADGKNVNLNEHILLRMLSGGSMNGSDGVDLGKMYLENKSKGMKFQDNINNLADFVITSKENGLDLSKHYIAALVAESCQKMDKADINMINLLDPSTYPEQFILSPRDNRFLFIQTNESTKSLITKEVTRPNVLQALMGYGTQNEDIGEDIDHIVAEYSRRNMDNLSAMAKERGMSKVLRDLALNNAEGIATYVHMQQLLGDDEITNALPPVAHAMITGLMSYWRKGVNNNLPGIRCVQNTSVMNSYWDDTDDFGNTIHRSTEEMQKKYGNDFTGTQNDYKDITFYDNSGNEVNEEGNIKYIKPTEILGVFHHADKFKFDEETSLNDALEVVFTKPGERLILNVRGLLKKELGLKYYDIKERHKYLYSEFPQLIKKMKDKEYDIDPETFYIKKEFDNGVDYFESLLASLDLYIVKTPTPTLSSASVGELIVATKKSDSVIFVPWQSNGRNNSDQDFDALSIYFRDIDFGYVTKKVQQSEDEEDFIYKEFYFSKFVDDINEIYGDIEYLTDQQLNNRTFQTTYDVLRDPRNARLLTDIVSTQYLEDAVDVMDIESKYKYDSDIGTMINDFVNAKQGSQLIGILTNHLTMVSRLARLSDNKVISGLGLTKESLSDQAEHPEHLLSMIGQFMQAAVDNPKLQLLGPLGISTASVNFIPALALTGMNIEQVIAFMTDPPIYRVLRRMFNSNNVGDDKPYMLEVINSEIDRLSFSTSEESKKNYNDWLDETAAYKKSQLGKPSDFSVEKVDPEFEDAMSYEKLADYEKYVIDKNREEIKNKAFRFKEENLVKLSKLKDFYFKAQFLNRLSDIFSMYHGIKSDPYVLYDRTERLEFYFRQTLNDFVNGKTREDIDKYLRNKPGKVPGSAIFNDTGVAPIESQLKEYTDSFMEVLMNKISNSSKLKGKKLKIKLDPSNGMSLAVYNWLKEHNQPVEVLVPSDNVIRDKFGNNRPAWLWDPYDTHYVKETQYTIVSQLAHNNTVIYLNATNNPIDAKSYIQIMMDRNRIAEHAANIVSELNAKAEGDVIPLAIMGSDLFQIATRKRTPYELAVEEELAIDKIGNIPGVVGLLPNIYEIVRGINTINNILSDDQNGFIHYSKFFRKMQDSVLDLQKLNRLYEPQFYALQESLWRSMIYDYFKQGGFNYDMNIILPIRRYDSEVFPMADLTEKNGQEYFAYRMPRLIEELQGYDADSVNPNNDLYIKMRDNLIIQNLMVYRDQLQLKTAFFTTPEALSKYTSAFKDLKELCNGLVDNDGNYDPTKNIAKMLERYIVDRYGLSISKNTLSSIISREAMRSISQYMSSVGNEFTSRVKNPTQSKYEMYFPGNAIISNPRLASMDTRNAEKKAGDIYPFMEKTVEWLDYYSKISAGPKRKRRYIFMNILDADGKSYRRVYNSNGEMSKTLPTDFSIISDMPVLKLDTAEEFAEYIKTNKTKKKFQYGHFYKQEKGVVNNSMAEFFPAANGREIEIIGLGNNPEQIIEEKEKLKIYDNNKIFSNALMKYLADNGMDSDATYETIAKPAFFREGKILFNIEAMRPSMNLMSLTTVNGAILSIANPKLYNDLLTALRVYFTTIDVYIPMTNEYEMVGTIMMENAERVPEKYREKGYGTNIHDLTKKGKEEVIKQYMKIFNVKAAMRMEDIVDSKKLYLSDIKSEFYKNC